MDAYLSRINYDGEVQVTPEVLMGLHRSHVESISFENLDVILGRGISLDSKKLQEKLVRRQRGGYCYEQNSLFAAALERIGFKVSGLVGRNLLNGGPVLPATHALLMVNVDGSLWLADTGFGMTGPLYPVAMDGFVDDQHSPPFKVCDAGTGDGARTLRSLGPLGWRTLYSFALNTVYPVDFTVMNHYSSTHQDSRFRRHLIAQRASASTRRSLRDTTYVIQNRGADVLTREISPGDAPRILAEDFKISITGEEAEKIIAKLACG
ncbi:arylamine N-acetyltransferase [Streptomyces sp. NPDC004787]|uniref:arylamine N-acetyltransferase family protein n=1 Tax=Streptomyces sp. NPDC004787 TaxID=3154291 RepID=UPI0033B36B50